MLVECGYVAAQAPDGREWSFTPALGRVAQLGRPAEIVQLYAELHGPRGADAAAYILACLCDQDDPSELIGWRDEAGLHPGAMPAAEQIIVAQHLMRHGICGTSKPSSGDGGYAQEFRASEHIAAGVAHLGMPPDIVAGMSMTELQMAFAAKYPDQAEKKRDVPSADEYKAFMAHMENIRGGK
jgi:hypothetical protein